MLLAATFIIFFAASGILQGEAIRCFVQPNPKELLPKSNNIFFNATAIFGNETTVDCGPQIGKCAFFGECRLRNEAAELLGDIGKFDIKGCFNNWHRISISQHYRSFVTQHPQLFGQIDKYFDTSIYVDNVCQLVKEIFGCEICQICDADFCNDGTGDKQLPAKYRNNFARAYGKIATDMFFGVDVEKMKELD